MKLQTKVRFADEKLKEAFERLKEGKGDEKQERDNHALTIGCVLQNAAVTTRH